MSIKTIDMSDALMSLRPNCFWTIRNNVVEWEEGNEDTVPTQEEIDAEIVVLQGQQDIKELRAERDAKLAETDWWASSDLTMTAEQTAYRQALRDITDTYSDLDTVVWPTKP
jgi:hypothetical protein